MKSALAALLIGLTACSGSSSDDLQAGTAQVAILGTDGNVALFDPDTGALTPLTTDAGLNRFYSQPTWSPDGSQLAVSVSAAAALGPGLQADSPAVPVSIQAQATVESAIELFSATGGDPTVISVPFAAFYLYWAPDGTHLAFLGNDSSLGQLRLGIVDVAAGLVDLIDTGQPYYFAWSPASDRLLVHRADRELFFLSIDGSRQDLGTSPGGYSAPAWIGDTLMVGWDDGTGPTTRLLNPDGSLRVEGESYSEAVVFALSPDQDQFAYIDIPSGANPFALGELTVASPNGDITVAEEAAAFFWDASGRRLLYLTPEIDGDTFALRWNVWDGATKKAFESFLPTATFVQQYLPFFGQYANSLSFFSPDGASFTFAGRIEGRGEGIWVQDIGSDGPAQLAGPGEFSTWSP